QPIKSDCQDFSLDGGRGCYFAIILVELFHIPGEVDTLRWAHVRDRRSTCEMCYADEDEEAFLVLLGRPSRRGIVPALGPVQNT
ncbi:hypothetical protein A2U01_0042243, partial [Trifolium medium]|nr:hypothetical protein [Trifolium medium]